MESAPALFAGTVFVLFGSGLLFWTAVRVARHAPWCTMGSPAAAAIATFFGAVSLLTGVRCGSDAGLTQVYAGLTRI